MDERISQQQQQQQQQIDVLYSPSAGYWMAPADTVLRSPGSAPALKQSPHYGRRNRRHSRTKSYSSSQRMDYDDEYLDRQLRPSNQGYAYSGLRNYHRYYDQEHQDYRNIAHSVDTQSSLQHSRMHTQKYQLQQKPDNGEQPYSGQRRTSLSSYTKRHPLSAPFSNYIVNNLDRIVATNISGVDHSQYNVPNVDQGQRKPWEQQVALAPIVSTSSDTNKISSYRRQEPVNLGHYHHHYAAHSGWKVSGQYNHSSPRSSLSPTPPSLYDNNSSSSTSYTAPSSSSSAPPMSLKKHQHSKSSNKNGVIGRKLSVDGLKQTTDYLHQQKQSILVSSSRTNTSSSLGFANHYYHTVPVKPSLSANSNNDQYQYFYGDCHDQQPNPCQNTHALRARRYSQGDSSYVNQHQTTTSFSVASQPTTHAPTPRRVSTPKLRRVCSAKPYMEQPLPRSGRNHNSFMDNDDDLLAVTMDAASLSLAKIKMATAGEKDNSKADGGDLDITEQQASSPTFWNPRSEKDIIPVKQTLSRRLRGLLLPQRNKLEAAVSHEQQLAIDYQWSLARPLTPMNELSFDNDAILEDQENGVVGNPFYIINQSWNIVDHVGSSFDDDNLQTVDTYVANIQKMHLSLTPTALSQQILTHPYRRDLYRLRALFTWIVRNIIIVDQEKQNGNSNDNSNYVGDAAAISGTTTASTGSTTTVTTIQPSKVSLRQRLTTRRNTLDSGQEEELEMPATDLMHGGGLLPEGGGNVDSFDDWLFSESAQQVLLRRECSSSIGMANLFCEMAISAGYHDARVVYGYLRAPKDSIDTARIYYNNYTNVDMDDNDNVTLIQNHAWCQVKVEGKYRFVDCWLASPFQPQNKTKVESHWFLTKPSDLIYTHFPQEPVDQCLEPTIHVTTFFALPYVWASYFTHNIKMIRYNPKAFNLVDDQVCHLVFRVDTDATCFAFVETDPVNSVDESSPTTTTTMRCLAQNRMVPDEHGSLERIYKVKAVLPPGYNGGWLKIYAGHSQSSTLNPDDISSGASTRQDRGLNGSSTSSTTLALPPLALCFRLTVQHTQHLDERLRPFEFVHLHPCRHENFYIWEPQCYQLYPFHTYNFFVRGDDMHHKLAIKSPGGKLYKLMYYPQEHTYDGSVRLAEIGKWSLVSLLNHSGDWSVVATWECRA